MRVWVASGAALNLILKRLRCYAVLSRLTFGKASGRFFASLLSNSLCIGYLIMLGNERKQTLHDQMAGTLILRGRGGVLQGGHQRVNDGPLQEPLIETSERRAEVSLRLCDSVITQVEQESVALDQLPGDSPLRRQYLRSLQLRADGGWMLKHADTPARFMEADTRLNEAVDELRAVRDSLA